MEIMSEPYTPRKIYPIIKTNYICNFNCEYCYYAGFHGREKEKMSIELAKNVMRKAASYNLARGGNDVKFYWHGGEPTLNGVDFFKEVVDFQVDLGLEIHNSMQTNGSLINDEWISFLKKNSFGVGVSMDGPSSINDLQRVNRNRKGTTAIVLANIRAMIEAGVNVGVLSVITNNHINAEQIYNFYVENNIDGVGFCKSFVANGSTVDERLTVSNKVYSKFLVEFFDLFFKGSYRMEQREYETAIRGLAKVGGNGVCSMSGRESCGMFLTVNWKGDVFFCEDYDLTDSVIGNIHDSDFEEIIYSSEYQKRKHDVLSVYQKCVKECNLATMCGGGCPRTDIITENGEMKNYFCEAFRTIYLHIEEVISPYDL